LTAQARGIDYRCDLGARTVWRIGYDLFSETRRLLTNGQPVPYAPIPTLEFHIAVVRSLLEASAVPYIEVPPRPAAYEFTCCLTHDLDFFGICRHTFDRTLAGFVARASVGTAIDVLRGRRPLSDLVRNWRALFSLPFVRLKLLPDLWRPIEDYIRADGGRRSTYFVIPFKGQPGRGPRNAVDRERAVAYGARDVADELARAARAGSELAVHGIDAWCDAERGRAELREITALTQRASAGVRMHWLYFDEQSPPRLEATGFEYDSTWGYNDAIGYRPGTSQVFRLPGTAGLMELPLAIMDSALFFPDRMNLPADEALQRCFAMVADVRRFGGTLVINWHDRSLAPERLWDCSYRALLDRIEKAGRVWFATASEAVAWFKWRRSIAFSVDASGSIRITPPASDSSNLPAACLRIYRHGIDRAVSIQELSFADEMTVDLVA
jgi:hypothetical protein